MTQAIARVVQTRYLAPFEEDWREAGGSEAASSALLAFGDLSAEFQSVFADPAVRTDDNFLAPIVAHHLLRGETDQAVAAAHEAPAARQDWLGALIEAAVPSEHLQVTEQAPGTVVEGGQVESLLRHTFESGDYATLLELAQSNSVDVVSIDYAVRAAYNLDTLAAAQAALGLLASADARVIEDARRDRSFRDAEAALREYVPPVAPDASAPAVSSWRDWFEVVARVPDWRGHLRSQSAVASSGHQPRSRPHPSASGPYRRSSAAQMTPERTRQLLGASCIWSIGSTSSGRRSMSSKFWLPRSIYCSTPLTTVTTATT